MVLGNRGGLSSSGNNSRKMKVSQDLIDVSTTLSPTASSWFWGRPRRKLLLLLFLLFVITAFWWRSKFQSILQVRRVSSSTTVNYDDPELWELRPRELQPDEYFNFIHIPKTGGVTVRYIIPQCKRDGLFPTVKDCGLSECCDRQALYNQVSRLLANPQNASAGFALPAERRTTDNPKPYHAGCQFLAAEQPYNSFVRLPPEEGGAGALFSLNFACKPRTWTIFRNPLDWARSAATHDMNHGYNGSRYSNFAEGFLERRHYFSVDNVQSRYISVAGLTPLPSVFLWVDKSQPDLRRGANRLDVIDDTLVENMKKRVLELDYFGLLEYFEASLCLLQFAYNNPGWEDCSPCKSSNRTETDVVVAPSDTQAAINMLSEDSTQVRLNMKRWSPEEQAQKLNFTPELQQQFLDRNQLDVLLYDFAKKVWLHRARSFEARTGIKLLCQEEHKDLS